MIQSSKTKSKCVMSEIITWDAKFKGCQKGDMALSDTEVIHEALWVASITINGKGN